MRCIIVDDDPMSRKLLECLCSKIEGISISGIFCSAIEAINFLKRESVDLILLDIEMPDMTGMEFLKHTPNLPQVIVTSSEKDYALEAFEYGVTDFIRKPVQLSRLVKSIERAQSRCEKKESKESDDIYVKVDGRLVRVDLNEVAFIESLGDYVVFNTEKKEKLIVHSTLKNIDDRIANSKFLKVHRSFIINLAKIIDIQETNLVVRDKVIPISRAHKPALMNQIRMV